MKFSWNEEKNELIKQTRGISFEEIVDYINNGYIIRDIRHPNTNKYPNQRIYLIRIDDYIYEVPYVINEEDNYIFLKTIIPTRKWTKILLNKNRED